MCVCVFVCLCVCAFVCLCVCLFVCLFGWLVGWLVCLFVCLFACLFCESEIVSDICVDISCQVVVREFFSNKWTAASACASYFPGLLQLGVLSQNGRHSIDPFGWSFKMSIHMGLCKVCRSLYPIRTPHAC